MAAPRGGRGAGGAPRGSGSRCSTSIRLVMKKLLGSAGTPRSGRIEVWRHTGHDRDRLWAGM